MSGHIHMVGDGRGQRRVLLNGNELTDVVYANTRTGVVRQYVRPLQVDRKRGTVKVRVRRGLVEVVAMGIEE